MKSRARGYIWGIGLSALLLGRSLAGMPGTPLLAHASAPPASSTPEGMVYIPAGDYTPLFQDGPQPGAVRVTAFFLDRYSVTNGQYLAFVAANPRWRRSRVSRLFADQAYLGHWQDDLRPAVADDVLLLRSPVTHVSWFAARAYCKWQQKRLPTIAQWEYVALASADTPDGRTEPEYLKRILEWYAAPSPPIPPPVGSGGKNYWGVYDLHGIIWEWVADFHNALVTGESRGDSDFERNLFCGAGATGVAGQERVNYPAFMRFAFRSSLQGSYAVNNLGFRCARGNG